MAWYDKIIRDPRFVPKSNRFVQLVEQAGISSFDTYVGDPKLVRVAAKLIGQPETRRDGLEIIVGDYVSANTIAKNSDLLTAMAPINLLPSKRVRAAIKYRRSKKS